MLELEGRGVPTAPMIRTARVPHVFSGLAGFAASSGPLAAETRPAPPSRTTPQGERVSAITPTVGPGLPQLTRAPATRTSPTRGNSPLTSTWQAMSVPPGIYLRAISMGSAQVGFAAGELGVVLK